MDNTPRNTFGRNKNPTEDSQSNSVDRASKRKEITWRDAENLVQGENQQDRFTDVMNRVTDLLKVNQTLWEENNDQEEDIRAKNIEIYEMKEESEDLRERIELLEMIVKNDENGFAQYISRFMRPKMDASNFEHTGQTQSLSMDFLCEELIEARKSVRLLEKRNTNLELQNIENHQRMNFIGNNEPSRPIVNTMTHSQDIHE